MDSIVNNMKNSLSYNNHEADKKLYQCLECGLNYEEKKWAEQCDAWCKKHHSCNLEIIIHAVENK